MKLTVSDRLVIPSLLPNTGTYLQYALKKSVRQKTRFTEEEVERLNIRNIKEEGKIVWDFEKEGEPQEIDFSADELLFLKQSCELLDNENLPDGVWATVEKIYSA